MLIGLFATTAYAQDAALDQQFKNCERHISRGPVEYLPPWQDCYRIRNLWNAAKAAAEAKK